MTEATGMTAPGRKRKSRMTVTQTEAAGTGNRYRVYLDGQFAFVLYKGELSRYHIRPGRELEPKELE